MGKLVGLFLDRVFDFCVISLALVAGSILAAIVDAIKY